MPAPTYIENVNNAPYGLANTNAPGSPYAAAFGRGTTSHLKLAVDPIIFDAQPQQFLDLQFLMAFASAEQPGDEIIWKEDIWGRTPLATRAAFANVAPSPGVTVTGTIPITAASLSYVFPNQVIYYRDDNGVDVQAYVMSVTSTPGAEAILVRSLVGKGLGPLATVGSVITNGMTGGADGQSYFSQPTRTQTIDRTNLMEKIGPEEKIWNHLERIKFKNLAQTNYMDVDMRNMLRMLKVSICQRIWLGQYGETLLSQGEIAKATQGIVPAIIANGGAVLNSTMATVWDDLTAGIFATNFGSTTNHRIVFGTPEMLHAMNVKQKAEFVRYASGDKVFDLDFEVWRFGGQVLTLVPVQIWNDPASFPEHWSRRLVVLQAESVKLVTMQGVPMMEQGLTTQSRTNITPSEIYDFERYFCQAFLGTMTQNAAMSFIIDVA